ncbi:reverse transcriptase domain-containing protein [Tanacetum coccineum]
MGQMVRFLGVRLLFHWFQDNFPFFLWRLGLAVTSTNWLISKSIFVTNFPDNTTSKDLWEVCKGYGTVVDVFIPDRKSKAGKRFAFVRFIKVDNVDRLVGNLCTLWIGRMHLHANVARFDRPPIHSSRPNISTRPAANGASSFASVLKGNPNTFNHIASSPAMVLDDECVVERDLDNFVMGEVKDFSSINNLRVLLSNEGFQHVRLAYLGGLWVMIELTSVQTKMRFMKHVGVASWFSQLCKAQPDFVSRERIVWIDIEGVPLHAWSRPTFSKIGSRWGEVIELEDNKEDCFARKRICIKTKLEDNILEKFKIIEVDDYSEDDSVNGAEEINGDVARKHKKQQAMVFKVDFAKAYDSIRWDFLEDVLRAFGFGSKWCSWIQGCLHSGMASEFQFHCGLKQGDPLAPYLFILIMESLHLSLSRAIEAGIFKGIKIGSSLNISHLFYADDAVFIGEWSIANLSGITHILHCFSLLYGLSINLKKSHLLGVGIRSEDVNAATLYFGCSTMKTPFKYLGVMVGEISTKFDETFYEAWDRFNDLLRACPHHGFSELHQLDTFYNALNSNDQDSLNSAAGGNFLDKMPRDCLRIIESKSKVRNSRNKPVVAKVSSSTSTPGISSDVAELKDMVKALLLDKKNQSPAPTPVKAVEESCVTCGGAHSYQTCPATTGNVYRDNIQEYVSQAAAANYNQGNTGYRAPISNQIRPPSFPPAQNNHNVQNQGNNQNRYQNRGNFNQAPAYQPPVHQGQIYRPQVVQPPAYQAPAYQAPAPQIQGVSKEDFQAYVKANDAVMRNMQTQGQNMQNQLTNLTDMLSKFLTSNTASTSGTLPSNTVTNPKEDLKGITTRSGVAYKGPTIHTTSSPKVVEREPKVIKDTMLPTNNGSTEDVQPLVVPIVHHESISEPVNALVSASRPNQKASIPFPSRRNDERRREKANDQIEKFYEIFRDLSFEISFTDALMLMPKFASTLKTLIGNKEKLSEMARTPLNENCSAVILNKLPKKLGDPGRFLIPSVEESCVTCGGAHSYQTCPATTGNVYRDNIQEYVSQAAAANYNQGNTGYRAPISNQIRPPDFPPVQNNHNVQNQGNNQNRYNQNRGNFNQAYQPPVNQGQIYRTQVEQPPEKANDQIEKFYEIFRDLSFEISFTDALMLMPKFTSTLKTLIGNKEKLSEMVRTPLNENCSAVILNKLPKKLGDPG